MKLINVPTINEYGGETLYLISDEKMISLLLHISVLIGYKPYTQQLLKLIHSGKSHYTQQVLKLIHAGKRPYTAAATVTNTCWKRTLHTAATETNTCW